MMLSKDIWNCIATSYLQKNDVAALMACNKTMEIWLKNNPRLLVRKLGSRGGIFWPQFLNFDWVEICDIYKENTFCVDIFKSGIDRGIKDFLIFGKFVKHLFPNIKEISVSQNYSYNDNDPDDME